MLYEKSDFDLNSPLVCEGVIGDGCGGGRLFLVEDETLFAYDPHTQEKMLLLKEIKNATKITKKACVIFIECGNEMITLNLSTLKES